MGKTKYIAASAAIFACATSGAQTKPEVSVEELYVDWAYYPASPEELRSTAGGESYTVISEDGKKIESYAYADGKKEGTLVDLSTAKGEFKIERIEGYEISSTGDYIIVWGNKQKIYRHSYTADHYVFDVLHNTLMPISEEGGEQEAAFSPNGAMVCYVRNNNMHVYKIRYQSHSAMTTDGERNKIINGIPDWVNEEEFAIKRSYAWSPDSKKIAYIRYDESEVPEYSFPLYMGSHPQRKDYALYPGAYTYKYPKAGEVNAKVTVHIYDLDTRTTKQVDLGKEECYVPRLAWTGQDNQLAVFKLNRLQNRMDVLGVDANSLVSTILMTERNSRFVDEPAYSELIFIHGGQDFVALSERDGWSHLYLYGINGVMKQKLTEGDFDVTGVYGIDEATNTLFYQAAKRTPMQREIYAINLTKKKETTIADGKGTNEGEFSKGCKYFIKSNSSVEHAPVYTVCDGKGKELRTLEDNAKLMEFVSTKDIAKKEFISVPAADGTSLNAYIVKPTAMDESKKYPVLMVQYSGPNSQMVLDEWGVDWEQTLASRGYIVACVDPRGTGARGEEFRKCTYQQLGRLESDDQIAAASYLASLPYVDGERIGIWGWSYGGFMSTSCLCKSEAFKVGIAVAPVINWRYYDTIYTERYMRKPDQNGNGYDDNSPLTMAANLHGKYLIISGTADDNVHAQNQMEMVDALVQANKQFDMMVYPNRNHSIYGGNVRRHLYNMMLNYIQDNL